EGVVQSRVGGEPARCTSAPAVAALRALQVRPEDVAENAEAAQELGMWPMEPRKRLGDEDTHRIVWIPGVLEDLDPGDNPGITGQTRSTGDRQLPERPPVGRRDRDRSRLLVDHGWRQLLERAGELERGRLSILGREDGEEGAAREERAVARVAEDRRAVNSCRSR